MALVEAAGGEPAIVITGASSGIGAALARDFAGDGQPLVLVARRTEPMLALARELSGAGRPRVEVLGLDLTAAGATDELARELAERGLTCDVLVNNAGYGLLGPATELDRDEQVGIVDLNVRALTDLTLAFLPGMRARGRGGVLNVASLAAFMPGPFMAAYYASKAYVLSFSQALSEELRGTGVTVTALCPGPVTTAFQDRAGMTKAAVMKFAKPVTAEAAARAGYRAFRAGRRVAFPTATDRLVTAARLMPAAIKLPLIARLQRGR